MNIDYIRSLEDFYHLEQCLQIDEFIKKLPIQYADILILELEGYTIKEIANVLDISYDNARQRLSRAKKMLKRYLT